MHNKPHSDEAKAKMRAARARQVNKWGHLPEADIVKRLIETAATTRSLAEEFGCSDSTIKLIFRRHTTPEQRLAIKRDKQARALKGYKHTSEFSVNVSHRMRENNPFKGKRHSEDFKKAQSERKRGKKLPVHVGIAISARAQGIPVEAWEGYCTTEAQRQRHGIELRAWREAVFTRDDYTCRLCGKRGAKLHAHHIKAFAKHPDLRFDVDNGVTLCHDPCHKSTFGKETEFEERFKN